MEAGSTPYRRHDLVRVDPMAWESMLAERPDLDPAMVTGFWLPVPNAEAILADMALIAGWARAERPLIVRSYRRKEARGHVPLGLQLPSREGLRRVPIYLQAAHLTPAAVPSLDEACAAAPADWGTTLTALRDLGRRFGLVPRPFGSLLLQAATGLAYLRDSSDLDLLWPMPDGRCPSGLLEALCEIAAAAPMRLDGEVLLPDGSGIQWRELAKTPGNEDVLVKCMDRLELRPASEFRDSGVS